MAQRLMVPVDSGELDVLIGGRHGRGTVAALHPTESMNEVMPLLAEITEARVVCVNPRGVGRSSPHRDVRDATIDGMAADLDMVRQALGLPRWVIWGMSGGSMVALASARWHREGIEGLVLDSASPCFASLLADPRCVLSPLHPRWRQVLAASPVAPDGPGSLSWTAVAEVGWVLRRAGGPALAVSLREPSLQMQRVMPSFLAFDARPWLGAIDVPALVLAGAARPAARAPRGDPGREPGRDRGRRPRAGRRAAGRRQLPGPALPHATRLDRPRAGAAVMAGSVSQ